MIHPCLNSRIGRHYRSMSFGFLAVSVLLISVFILGCGDEGDAVEDGTGGRIDVLQPATTSPLVEPSSQVEEADVPEPPEVIEEPAISFKNDIAPILAERCATPRCHVAGGAANLNLTMYNAFKQGGVSGPAFVAGDGKGSLVVKRIDGGGMPPGGLPLDKEQIQRFIDWITEGAEDN